MSPTQERWHASGQRFDPAYLHKKVQRALRKQPFFMLFNRRISFLIFHRMRSYPIGIIWGENIALWVWYRNMRMRQSFTELHGRNADSERKHSHTKFISYREIILFSSVLNFRLSKSRILASSSAKSKVWTGNRLRLNPGRLHGLQSYPGPKELRCANSDQCCVSVSRYP